MNEVCRKCKQLKKFHWNIAGTEKFVCNPDIDAPEFEAE